MPFVSAICLRKAANGRDGRVLALKLNAMRLPNSTGLRHKAVWGPKRILAAAAIMVVGLAPSALAEGHQHSRQGRKAAAGRPNSAVRPYRLDHELTFRAARGQRDQQDEGDRRTAAWRDAAGQVPALRAPARPARHHQRPRARTAGPADHRAVAEPGGVPPPLRPADGQVQLPHVADGGHARSFATRSASPAPASASR